MKRILTISTTATSQFTCEVDSYKYADWFGTTYHPSDPSTGEITSARIIINSYLCASDSNSRKSTITHEIGHLLGLADEPPVGADKSLMCYDRDRSVIYQPQPFDIANVKYIFFN